MKKVAFTESSDGGKYFLKKRYVEYLMHGAWIAGCELIPIILPPILNADAINSIVSEFDGFILTGGGDIDPRFYGEPMAKETTDIDMIRDNFEIELTKKLISADRPVLGVCRGIQVMAVACDGTLFQNMPYPAHAEEEAGEHPHHTVSFSGKLRDIAGCDEAIVNSFHHQSVKTAGKCEICAVSSDGSCEAVFMEKLKFFLGVQWHPEISPDDISSRIIKAFVSSL